MLTEVEDNIEISPRKTKYCPKTKSTFYLPLSIVKRILPEHMELCLLKNQTHQLYPLQVCRLA